MCFRSFGRRLKDLEPVYVGVLFVLFSPGLWKVQVWASSNVVFLFMIDFFKALFSYKKREIMVWMNMSLKRYCYWSLMADGGSYWFLFAEFGDFCISFSLAASQVTIQNLRWNLKSTWYAIVVKIFCQNVYSSYYKKDGCEFSLKYVPANCGFVYDFSKKLRLTYCEDCGFMSGS